jgi:hypothetical protein
LKKHAETLGFKQINDLRMPFRSNF